MRVRLSRVLCVRDTSVALALSCLEAWSVFSEILLRLLTGVSSSAVWGVCVVGGWDPWWCPGPETCLSALRRAAPALVWPLE